jgi:hypothetical protein
MATYVPDATNASEPVGTRPISTAAPEFRALKQRVNQLTTGMGKNKIINGKMEIAQRGTSFAAVGNGTYTLDRFAWNTVGAGIVTISQQSDVPTGDEFQNSLRVAVTTADTSIASTDAYAVYHAVEGYNARDLIGRTFTLSFWVRSTKTGTHCVAFSNSTVDRSYVATYTVNASNTWEKKSVTVSGGLITAGTWNWTNGVGIYLRFTLAVGSTRQTTAGAWQTGEFWGTSAQVNCMDSTSNIFAITGVQLEVGSVDTPFEHRPYQTELALAQRYYEVGGNENIYSGYANSGSAYYDAVRYAVVKRATPSTIVFSDVANVGFPNSAPTLGSNNASGFYAQKTSNATSTAAYFQYSWTSNAEL